MRVNQKFLSAVVGSGLVVLFLFSAPTISRGATTNLNAGETINLATVIDNSLSVWIGDKVFEGFSWSLGGIYASDLDMVASNVNVRALVSPDIGFRLEFQLPMTAGDMEFKDIGFFYTAAVTNSPNLISDIHLSITGATVGGAIGSVAETAWIGGFGATLVGSVDVSLPGPPTNSVSILNNPVVKVWIEKDIIVSGNFDDSVESASISTIEQTFSQIPEPSTVLLVGLGLLGVVAVNRKRKSC